jgi:hypothetical protein
MVMKVAMAPRRRVMFMGVVALGGT